MYCVMSVLHFRQFGVLNQTATCCIAQKGQKTHWQLEVRQKSSPPRQRRSIRLQLEQLASIVDQNVLSFVLTSSFVFDFDFGAHLVFDPVLIFYWD